MATIPDFDSLPAAAVVRVPEVLRITGMSRTTLWRRCRDGGFPQPVRLPGSAIIGWRAGDVRRWLASLADADLDTVGQERCR